ncbi:MAG: error-prone DNA polymerase, partial [Gammaproteobacteria bacterium]
ALTDECSVAGIVRAHRAALECGIRLIVGSEFYLKDGMHMVLLAANARGYRQLCELITKGRRLAAKGSYLLERKDFECSLEDCLAIWMPAFRFGHGDGVWLARHFPARGWIGVSLLSRGDDADWLARMQHLSARIGVPLVAVGAVCMHVRARRPLHDILTAIRLNKALTQAVGSLHSNGERHIRKRAELATVYSESLLAETQVIAGRLSFSLDELQYRYPREVVPDVFTPTEYLRHITEQGMQQRWPDGAPAQVRKLIHHELQLIAELGYEPYFLTVYDIVKFARSKNILCQGRGSAANSAVCFCLGITEVDPARISVLMERFISRERNEPPDIDIDFEHNRREEVIQYIYGKYGRARAALTATVITYGPRSAVRDVGKALGLQEHQLSRMARSMQWWDGRKVRSERVREAGFDPDNPLIHKLLVLCSELLNFPRHLSQHVGGFLISDAPLSQIVPVENAAMEERTVIQWDKNDLDDMGLLKVDVLGLGMLSAIQKSFTLYQKFYGRPLCMAGIPAEDPAVYDMICAADTVGVFQIESRAQMSMLPRLKPRCFYDLVVEVAIVRPGPIQGDMVHPYLRRRSGEEPVSYASEEVERVLERTLGVPIFQEQVMQLAMVAAGFSAGEADNLRRAMAAWKRRGGLEPFERRLLDGMQQRGYTEQFAQQIFKQIRGFGEYGFPESHAASFALLVYISAWLKCHEPAVFFCALLNSQPMGFYAPAQLVQAAHRHGVAVFAVDANISEWDSALEADSEGRPGIRLGLHRVHGLSRAGGDQLLTARRTGCFASVHDLASRARLNESDFGALAAADALSVFAGHRHMARWSLAGIESPTALFGDTPVAEGLPLLNAPTEGQDIVADYATTGLSLRRHPLALLRERLRSYAALTAEELWTQEDDALVYAAGLVITRQRPGSAANVTFATLEDETGSINLVVWERLAERQRKVLLGASLLGVRGRVQKKDGVLHIIAVHLVDHSRLLSGLAVKSRDFR